MPVQIPYIVTLLVDYEDERKVLVHAYEKERAGEIAAQAFASDDHVVKVLNVEEANPQDDEEDEE